MSYQIIKQPDGRWAVWTTLCDAFVLIDATEDDIGDLYVGEAQRRFNQEIEDIRTRVATHIRSLEQGGKPYHQFTMDWETAAELYEANHGKPCTLEALRKEASE